MADGERYQKMDPRFTTQPIGRYTAEYDHEGAELRLCWSGSQAFLTQEETAALLQFLQSVCRPVPQAGEPLRVSDHFQGMMDKLLPDADA